MSTEPAGAALVPRHSTKSQYAAAPSVNGKIALGEDVHADQHVEMLAAGEAETEAIIENERQGMSRGAIGINAYAKEEALGLTQAMSRLKRPLAVGFKLQLPGDGEVDGTGRGARIDQRVRSNMRQIRWVVRAKNTDRQ